jgi:hypothetical protein
MTYPAKAADRDVWILQRRGPKNSLDPWRPYAYLWEEEIGADGDLITTATIFITNHECPFRCLMCDLWRNTLDDRVPAGAIPAQIRYALQLTPPARQIKLYNSGNFFDPHAIPPEDYDEIADLLAGFERVIVESHPVFLRGEHGERCLHFRDLIEARLEVAIGIETIQNEALERLNKRMTVESFERAAEFLLRNEIDLRVFILLKPPFLDGREGLEWACRSIDFALERGATACTIIPTRGGNGAMEALNFAPPKLRSLESAQEYGLTLKRGRIFADLWDIDKFFDCDCSAGRARRLDWMNRRQQIPDPIICRACESCEN